MTNISNNKQHTASTEDYLEVMYEFTSNNLNFKAVDIAKKLNISRASVSEALQKLSEQGLVVYQKYKPAYLTEKGEKIAKEVLFKHKTLCAFFKKILNLSEEEAQINACRIEHVITDNAFEKIKGLINE